MVQRVNGNIQVHTTGCELCVYDACKFASTLNPDEKAIVFNTCSFVEDREIENLMISRLLRKAYPDHKMYIIGCDVNYHKDYFDGIADVLMTNEEVREIIESRDIKDGESSYTSANGKIAITFSFRTCFENPSVRR